MECKHVDQYGNGRVDYGIIVIHPDGKEEYYTALCSEKFPSYTRAIEIRDDWALECLNTYQTKVEIAIRVIGFDSWCTIMTTEPVYGKLSE